MSGGERLARGGRTGSTASWAWVSNASGQTRRARSPGCHMRAAGTGHLLGELSEALRLGRARQLEGGSPPRRPQSAMCFPVSCVTRAAAAARSCVAEPQSGSRAIRPSVQQLQVPRRRRSRWSSPQAARRLRSAQQGRGGIDQLVEKKLRSLLLIAPHTAHVIGRLPSLILDDFFRSISRFVTPFFV